MIIRIFVPTHPPSKSIRSTSLIFSTVMILQSRGLTLSKSRLRSTIIIFYIFIIILWTSSPKQHRSLVSRFAPKRVKAWPLCHKTCQSFFSERAGNRLFRRYTVFAGDPVGAFRCDPRPRDPLSLRYPYFSYI